MGHQRGSHQKCRKSGKTQFRSFNFASRAVRKIDPEAQVYRCTACGFYHMTSWDPAFYDRQQAERKTRRAS